MVTYSFHPLDYGQRFANEDIPEPPSNASIIYSDDFSKKLAFVAGTRRGTGIGEVRRANQVLVEYVVVLSVLTFL